MKPAYSSTTHKKITATDKAYTAIRTAISEQKLRPGYPLLETEIAEQLGVSRTPVREAINRLKAEGIVETVRRKGIFVKALSIEEICQSYEVAEALEGMVAYLVASAPDATLDELEKAILAMEEALAEKNTDAWVIADENYHQALYSLCKNQYIIDDLKILNDKLRFSRLFLISGSVTDKTQSTREHRSTFEAIQAGDAELARTITQNHWHRVRLEIPKLQSAHASDIEPI